VNSTEGIKIIIAPSVLVEIAIAGTLQFRVALNFLRRRVFPSDYWSGAENLLRFPREGAAVAVGGEGAPK